MVEKSRILIAGHSRAACEQLKGMLEQQHDLDVRTSHEAAKAEGAPDLLVVVLDGEGQQTLDDWSFAPGLPSPPMIVIGATEDTHLMRRAMQVGARDYFSQPVAAGELLAAVHKILSESTAHPGSQAGGKLTAVINAKGGSGASMIACNLAHMLAVNRRCQTALIDMDLQFGALPLALDLTQRHTLFDVIGAVEQLDSVALKSYMTEHSSGLHVLGTMSEQLMMPWAVSVESVQRIFEVALQTYEHVVVDLPRQIDPLASIALSAAEHVLVVMQLSFAHLRDTKRMFSLLRGQLGVPTERIVLVINRYETNNAISVEDVRKAMQPALVVLIPNDYGNVTGSLNLGVPLYQHARNAPVTKALCNLAERLDAGAGAAKPDIPPPKPALRRVFGLRT